MASKQLHPITPKHDDPHDTGAPSGSSPDAPQCEPSSSALPRNVPRPSLPQGMTATSPMRIS